jgi:hypothetical protein
MIVAIHFAIISVVMFNTISEENNKKEAQKLLDFKNTDYSCNELGKFYLKYEPSKYKSSEHLRWYWLTEDKLIDNKCASQSELNNLEFINLCMNSNNIGCEMSKLENPELYENFVFNIEFDKLLQQKNQEVKGN